MAEEGYEAYHVPQQSRRDKLRVVAGQNQPTLVESPSTAATSLLPPHPAASSSSSLLPLYDPCSLIPSDLLTCAPQHQHGNFHHHGNSNNSNCAVKEEQRSGNLMMAFSSPSSANNNNHHHHQGNNNYNLDLPEPSNFPNLNPGASIHIFGTHTNNSSNNNSNSNNPFLYHHLHQPPPPQPPHQQNLMSDIMVFKPEPLSLSLSSQHHHHNSSNNLPLELNLQRYHGVIPGLVVGGGNNSGGGSSNGVIGGSSVSNEGSRSSVVLPMGPFTGYASVLKGSRFLRPAKELLEELCDVGVAGVCVGGGDDDVAADASLMMMEPPPSSSMDQCLNGGGDHHEDLADHHGVEGRKKSRLLTMLDEVYRRYRQYYQQMHAVVTSFEYVSGLSNAAPYASLAIKTMSKHFRCLKNAITDQLQFTNKAQYHLSNRKDESPRFGNTDRGPYGQRSGFIEHQPVWRPQRGLPERAVTVLRAWLFEHFLHPYPTDTDKLMLAKETGLSRSQVSNWFINARVRLWKPMVEEIHMLETRQGQKNPQREEHSRNRSSDHLPSLDNSLVSENPSTSTDRFQDAPYKQRTMNELPNIPVRSQEQLNLPCTGNQPVGVGVSMAGSASNSVSLTLGLHQNHGIGLAEPFPLSAAQRFGLGLETNTEGYVMNGFESQNRHFGRDVIGGQLLHDFVG